MSITIRYLRENFDLTYKQIAVATGKKEQSLRNHAYKKMAVSQKDLIKIIKYLERMLIIVRDHYLLLSDKGNKC